MGAAADRLTSLREAPDRFDIPVAEQRSAQIEAANERLQERTAGHQAARPSRRGSRPHRSARFRRHRAAAVRAHRLQELSRSLADRAEMGSHGPLARHGFGPSRQRHRHIGRPGHRRLDRAAGDDGPFRFLFERHDRQVSDADRFGGRHGLVETRFGRGIFLGIGRRTAAGPADVRPGHRSPACRAILRSATPCGPRSAIRASRPSSTRFRRSRSARSPR